MKTLALFNGTLVEVFIIKTSTIEDCQMNNITKSFTLLLVGFSANMFAQTTATAIAMVNIVTPIGITKSVDMVFGNVATTAASGTVVLGPDGTRTPSGSVTLPAMAGTVTAATFTVTGAGNYTYTITLPAAPITLAGATAGVTVGSFVSNPSTTGKLVAGTQTVNVGATLNIPVSTAAGTYTNAAGLSVSVNYN
jgi:hypothetical protein